MQTEFTDDSMWIKDGKIRRTVHSRYFALMPYTGFKDKAGVEIYKDDFIMVATGDSILFGYVDIDSRYGFILHGHVPTGDFKKEDMEDITKLPHIPQFYFYDDVGFEVDVGSDILKNTLVVGHTHELNDEQKKAWGLENGN